MTKYICIGRVLCTHGIKGVLKIESYTQNPHDFFGFKIYDSQNNLVNINLIKHLHDSYFFVNINNICTKTDAESFSGLELFTTRDQLPAIDESEFYFNDLINLKVKNDMGSDVGLVQAVSDHGAGPFAEIKTVDNKIITAFLNKESIDKIDKEIIVIKNQYIIA